MLYEKSVLISRLVYKICSYKHRTGGRKLLRHYLVIDLFPWSFDQPIPKDPSFPFRGYASCVASHPIKVINIYDISFQIIA